jgi:hypothetical protein
MHLLVPLLIIAIIIALIALLAIRFSAFVRRRAIAQLRSQLTGTWTTAPPPVAGSNLSTFVYTLTLGPMAPMTAQSPFHGYLSVEVTYTLTGAGGAVFPDGSRKFVVPMSQTGQAMAAVRAVANGSDKLAVSYKVTDIRTNEFAVVPGPTHDFETRYP